MLLEEALLRDDLTAQEVKDTHTNPKIRNENILYRK
jgi:hypothetical protein